MTDYADFRDYRGPIRWAGDVVHLAEFESIHVQVVGTPSVPYVIQRSLTLDEWSPATLLNYGSAVFPNGTWVVEALAIAGFYQGIGRGYFRFLAGAGSMIFLSAHDRED